MGGTEREEQTKEPSQIFVDLETIRLTNEGVFLSDRDGEPEEILHARTVDAFHRFLGRDEEGYFVSIGRDFKRILVDDTPRFVTAVRFEGDGSNERAIVKLYGGLETPLDLATLRYDGASRLVCRVPAFGNLGEADARFLRAPYLEFFLRTLDESGEPTIQFAGKRFPLASG